MRGSRPRSRVPRRRASSAPRVRPVACAALYCLRSTYVAAETRGDGRFRRLCAPYFSLPRWRYFFEAQRTRPLFARASQLCSRPCFNLRGTSRPHSLAPSSASRMSSSQTAARPTSACCSPSKSPRSPTSGSTRCVLGVISLGGCVVAWLLGCSVVGDALDVVHIIVCFVRCRLTSRRSPATPVTTAQGRVPHRPERLQFRLHGGLLRSGHGQLRRRPRGHHRAH